MFSENLESKADLTLDELIELNEIEKGNLYLISEIDNDVTYYIIGRLSAMLDIGIKDIKLYINSPGGEIFPALALYDRINYLRKTENIKVTSIVEGEACSAASMIVMQAANLRLAMENSRLMIHEPYEFIVDGLTVTKYRDKGKEMERVTKTVLEILGRRCNKSIEEIHLLIKNTDVFMTVQEALRFGIIDGILK